MNGITPCLWFDDQAEEAARFYTSVFKNSRIGSISHYGDSGAGASGRPKGSVLMVDCENQPEIDDYWAKLSAGGSEGQCGWLKDKYGLSWQVVPTAMGEMMQENDPEKLNRVMAAVLTMKKLDLAALERAAAG